MVAIFAVGIVRVAQAEIAPGVLTTPAHCAKAESLQKEPLIRSRNSDMHNACRCTLVTLGSPSPCSAPGCMTRSLRKVRRKAHLTLPTAIARFGPDSRQRTVLRGS